MKTIVLSGRSRRGQQKLQQHGTTWEVLKAQPWRVLVQSLTCSSPVGGGRMEKDWRWIQLDGDKDFKIEIGRGQFEEPVVRRTVLESTCQSGHPSIV